MEVKYPDVFVELVGQDGNAFFILGRVSKALRSAGVPQSEINEFHKEATSGDYNHLLQTVMAWVNVDSDNDEEDDYESDWEDDEMDEDWDLEEES